MTTESNDELALKTAQEVDCLPMQSRDQWAKEYYRRLRAAWLAEQEPVARVTYSKWNGMNVEALPTYPAILSIGTLLCIAPTSASIEQNAAATQEQLAKSTADACAVVNGMDKPGETGLTPASAAAPAKGRTQRVVERYDADDKVDPEGCAVAYSDYEELERELATATAELSRLRADADIAPAPVAHKPGCPALGGYGHGIESCACNNGEHHD